MLLPQKTGRPTVKADDADARMSWVRVKPALKPLPLGIDDAPRQDVGLMSQARQRLRNLFDVDQLPPKIRMGRPISILRIKIPLGVQKGDPHQLASSSA
jgi:hypothetical protein